MEWYGVKVENLPSLLLLPLFHPVKIDVFCTWSTNQQRDPMHSRAILFPSPLDADHCSLFAGFLRSFVRNTVAENSAWSMVTGFTVHWIVSWMLLVVRGAPSPKNGSNWSFFHFRV